MLALQNRRLMLWAVLLIIALAGDARAAERLFDVRDFGAVGDGVALNTQAIQKAIDACAEAGGGAVWIGRGRYLSGALRLKSHVTLHIDAGAVLLGSTRLDDYPSIVPARRSYTDNYTERSLLYAENVEHIALTGLGAIDGQGAAFKGPYKVRPYMIRVIDCRHVAVRDLTIRDSPMWVQHYLACDHVTIDGITVHSLVNANNDGIDIDSCDYVRISDCDVRSGDDAIVLKSTTERPCRHVAITNCVLSSDCNALKLGTESNGGFQNITISNCAIYDTRLAGIALELVDGGRFERVTVSNIVMDNVRGGLFIRLGNRARPFRDDMDKPGMGSMRDVVIANVQATGLDRTGCSITGLPDFPVENVTLENIRLAFAGGGAADEAQRPVEEFPEKYPEYKMFGTLPAYGFFVRHARNVNFRDIELRFEKPDARPAVVCEDVRDLTLLDFDAQATSATRALIRLRDVDGALIHGCRPTHPVAAFLRLEGQTTRDINLFGNDLDAAAQAVSRATEVIEPLLK